MPRIKKSRVKYVPYVKGFRPPTEKQRNKAIINGKEDVPVEFHTGIGFWESIPKCTSVDDWLAQYNVKGQTYWEYLQCLARFMSQRKLKHLSAGDQRHSQSVSEKYPDGVIYVLPLGVFDEANGPKFDDLIEYAQLFYCLPVRKHPAVELEFVGKDIYWILKHEDQELDRVKMKSRYDTKSGHRQLQVELALANLEKSLPADGLCMIALTMCDLYADQTDLFVAGMAAVKNSVAIFSLLRYNPNVSFSPEYWHNITYSRKVCNDEQKRVMLARSCRLLVHELAHLFGVDHCKYYACCMNGSGHLEEDYRQPLHLCPLDLRKLQKLTNFHVIERYQNLLVFYQKHKFCDEAKWVQKRLRFLKMKTK